jgi:hypothetical protein
MLQPYKAGCRERKYAPETARRVELQPALAACASTCKRRKHGVKRDEWATNVPRDLAQDGQVPVRREQIHPVFGTAEHEYKTERLG